MLEQDLMNLIKAAGFSEAFIVQDDSCFDEYGEYSESLSDSVVIQTRRWSGGEIAFQVYFDKASGRFSGVELHPCGDFTCFGDSPLLQDILAQVK